jgi:signal transduction histidine kinase
VSSVVDPRWPKVLSLTVHEFRTPMTVVSGYIRMLLKERAGAITDQQRKLLEEAEKSCARLSALVAEVSELSNLEGGTLPFNMSQTDVRGAVRQAVEQLPPLPDREVRISLELADAGGALVNGDPVRLAQAFTSIVAALRRELIGDEPLHVRELPASGAFDLLVGDADAIAAMTGEAELPTFDEWRGGVGLSLAVARRIVERHGGRLLGAPDGRKSGARVRIPLS